MRTIHRHTALFGLILMLATPLIWNTIALVREKLHFYDMQETMEQAALHTLHVPESSAQWTKSGKEIRINGKLFDVKWHRASDGMLTVTGLFDEEEEQISKSLSAYQNTSQPFTEPTILLLANFFTPALPPVNRNSATFAKCLPIEVPFSPGHEIALPERDFPIPTPPPRFF
jgi:hypothetical protein